MALATPEPLVCGQHSPEVPVSDLIVRWGGLRAVAALTVKSLLIVVLGVIVPLCALDPFGATHTPAVEIHDEAEAVDDDALRSALEDIGFRRDIRLAVFTTDDVDPYASSDTVFNDAVLGYALNEQPSWISTADPDVWADGLVILAVSPQGRWVGCYFGEDVKVDLRTQQKIQDSAKGSFRMSQWEAGLEAMAKRTADSLGKPIASTEVALLVAFMGLAAALAVLAWMFWSRRVARDAYKQARRHFTQVTTDYDATQIRAGTIPADNAHGAQVLARFAWFEERYAELVRLFSDFGSPRGAQWFMGSRRRCAQKLAASAKELDRVDDLIASASTFLTLGPGWEEVWENEQGPVREDLGSYAALCASVAFSTQRAKVSFDVAPDRDLVRERRDRLAAMTSELVSGDLTPLAALDELDAMDLDVHHRCGDLAWRALAADTSSTGRKRLARYEKDYAQGKYAGESADYQGWWSSSARSERHHYDPATTIRINSKSVGLDAPGLSVGLDAPGLYDGLCADQVPMTWGRTARTGRTRGPAPPASARCRCSPGPSTAWSPATAISRPPRPVPPPAGPAPRAASAAAASPVPAPALTSEANDGAARPAGGAWSRPPSVQAQSATGGCLGAPRSAARGWSHPVGWRACRRRTASGVATATARPPRSSRSPSWLAPSPGCPPSRTWWR
ncbi:Signal peptide protein, YSIRK [Actinomyces succiniciruminis]|uniref:Signal peptide protein, YSIRK n=1 Tax=Actinomyces succiniciruminis TaxID=1522002 RepID=A0A1L7RR69_9ACTO|nr:Signal peptide protein, YSIRK [Actinomyces succiniciruminis]